MLKFIEATHARSLVSVFGLALVLSGCFGGSSSSSDDDELADNDSNGSANDDDNGAESENPLAGAEELLYFTDWDPGQTTDITTKPIKAVNPDNPGIDKAVAITPLATNNADSRSDGSTEENRGGNFYAPNGNNLPLGVLERTINASSPSVVELEEYAFVYNTPEGHLYRVDMDSVDPSPARISNEEEANVVCAAKVLPDYQDVENTLIAYQRPWVNGQRDCSAQTEWFAVRLGADESDEPLRILEPLFTYDDFNRQFSEDWVTAVRDEEGSITQLIVYSGTDNLSEPDGSARSGSLELFDLATEEYNDLDNLFGNLLTYDVLGTAGDPSTLVVNSRNDPPGTSTGGLRTFSGYFDLNEEIFRQIEGPEGLGNALSLDHVTTDASSSVEVGEDLYAFDREGDDSSTGRLVRIEVSGTGAESTVVNDDWGTQFPVQNITVDISGDRIGWMYSTGSEINQDDWKARSVELPDGSDVNELFDGSLVLTNDEFASPLTSESAKGGQILLSSIEGNAVTAKAIPLDGSEVESIDDSSWFGNTRERALIDGRNQGFEVLGFRDTLVVFNDFESPTTGGGLFQGDERPIGSPFDVNLSGTFRENTDQWLAGYGRQNLIGWRNRSNSFNVVYYMDTEKPELVLVSRTSRRAVPIAFY